jgi:hypothetical protein
MVQEHKEEEAVQLTVNRKWRMRKGLGPGITSKAQPSMTYFLQQGLIS